MINLQHLEENFDLLFERETRESFEKWLVDRKTKEFLSNGIVLTCIDHAAPKTSSEFNSIAIQVENILKTAGAEQQFAIAA